MALAIGGMGRCREDAGEQKRGPVSLGINLATGSTNRLSPPISRRHTDSYLYCQVAAAVAAAVVVAAREKRGDSSKKLGRYWDSSETKCNATEHIKGPGTASEAPIHEEAPSGRSCQGCLVKCLIYSADIFSQMKIKLLFFPTKMQRSCK